MAQSSMLELLALTDAAVKGLDKSVRSSSASSRSSRGSVRKAQHYDSSSHDSGICKTNTVTEKNGGTALGHPFHDSDESTTASDVLITSTTVDPDQRSFMLQDGENLSNVSKCSKISIGSENFNTSGAQKVKISTKRLREIKSPFNTSPRGREDKENDKQSAPAVRKAPAKPIERSVDDAGMNSDDKNLNKNAIAKPVVSKTSNFKVQSAPRGLSEMTKRDDKEDDHFFSPMQTQRSDTFDEFSPRDEGKELKERKGIKTHVAPPNTPDPYRVSKQKAAGVIVERHTPKKMIQPERRIHLEEFESQSDHGKDPTLDLSGSFDLPEKEVASPVLNVSGSSRESSQPEIVTIPERIVTVSARTSLSTDASLSDTGPLEQEEERVPPMLSARYQLGSKMTGGGLRQGAPVEGASGLNKRKESPEVRISSFKMSEKQKLIRQTFAKRYEQPGPVKRVVQPRIVGADKKGPEVTGEGSKVTGQTSEAIAVAVAASAAVAATQPFLKAQQDLESKMAQILEKMAVIQNSGSAKQIASDTEATVQESQRVMALERQVSQLTDQRIEHLERLQEHQLQMQAKLISLTRDTPHTRSAVGSPQRTPPQQRKFPTPGATPPRRAFSKTTVNRTCVSPKGSPLDTPAPRSRAPRPVAYDPSAMADSKTQQSKGILEEILASAGSPTNGGQGITIHQPVYSR